MVIISPTPMRYRALNGVLVGTTKPSASTWTSAPNRNIEEDFMLSRHREHELLAGFLRADDGDRAALHCVHGVNCIFGFSLTSGLVPNLPKTIENV